MASFSSTVKVIEVQDEDFGGVATVEPVQPSVGIDVTLAGFWQLHFTEDAAELFKMGKKLTLTVSD